MKKLFKRIKKAFKKATIVVKIALANIAGEGYIDTGIKIIIGVVIGGIILAGLYALFNTTIIPTMTSNITDMFSYSGS